MKILIKFVSVFDCLQRDLKNLFLAKSYLSFFFFSSVFLSFLLPQSHFFFLSFLYLALSLSLPLICFLLLSSFFASLFPSSSTYPTLFSFLSLSLFLSSLINQFFFPLLSLFPPTSLQLYVFPPSFLCFIRSLYDDEGTENNDCPRTTDSIFL